MMLPSKQVEAFFIPGDTPVALPSLNDNPLLTDIAAILRPAPERTIIRDAGPCVQRYISRRDSGPLKPELIAQKFNLPIAAVTVALSRAANTGLIVTWRYRACNRLRRDLISEQQRYMNMSAHLEPDDEKLVAVQTKIEAIQGRHDTLDSRRADLHRRMPRPRPASLIEALADRGRGLKLRDSEGRWYDRGAEIFETFARKGCRLRILMPLYGTLLSQKGMCPERAAEFATEQGYVQPNNIGNGVDMDAFFDAFETDYSAWHNGNWRGRVFAAHDVIEAHDYFKSQDRITQIASTNKSADNLSQIIDRAGDFEDYILAAGIDLKYLPELTPKPASISACHPQQRAHTIDTSYCPF